MTNNRLNALSGSRKRIVIGASIVAFIVLIIALFDWNLLRGSISGYISNKLDRRFSIDGNLHVRLSHPIVVEAEQVTLANKAWGSEPIMAQADRVLLKLDLRGLFTHHILLTEISLIKPRLLLEKNTNDEENWTFTPKPEPNKPGPDIGLLTIQSGTLRYRNPELEANVELAIDSDPQKTSDQYSTLRFEGKGRFHNEPFTVNGSGTTPLSLLKTSQPYHMAIHAQAGKTVAEFTGDFVPAQLQSINGRIKLTGDDLSKLHPLVPLPLPWTPPYAITGELIRKEEVWSLRQASGRVGNSDLSGEISFNRNTKPRLVVADLTSRRLDYKDLGGIVGIPPGNKKTQSTEQKQETEKREASEKVLPTRPYNLHGLRQVNAEVHFRGKQIIAHDLPFDNLDARILLKDGELKLQPLDFGIGGGHVVSHLTLDAREATMKATGDATVHRVELEQVFPQLKPPNGSAGKVGGKASFSSTGNSVAELLGAINGELALIAWGGKASTLTLVLTNLDLARAGTLLLRGDQESSIRCLVGDFQANEGVVTPRSLIIDTDAVNIVGTGTIDFRNELYDLHLKSASKRPSPLALRGPIVIKGAFKKPYVGPDVGPLAGRVAGAVALGVLATPVAALLPLIDVGGGKDSDCGALIAQAQKNVEKAPTSSRSP